MGEISKRCKKRRKVLEIIVSDSIDGQSEAGKQKVVHYEVIRELDKFTNDDVDVSDILAEVHSFDHLLSNGLQDFETDEPSSESFKYYDLVSDGLVIVDAVAGKLKFDLPDQLLDESCVSASNSNDVTNLEKEDINDIHFFFL